MRRHTNFQIAPGSRVFFYQAFQDCGYGEASGAQIVAYLTQNGLVVRSDPKQADVLLIHTSGRHADDLAHTLEAIQRLAVIAPFRPLVITGNLNAQEPNLLREVAEAWGGDFALFDPRHLDGLDEIFPHAAVEFFDVLVPPYDRLTTDFARRMWKEVDLAGLADVAWPEAGLRAVAAVREGLAQGQADIRFTSIDAFARAHGGADGLVVWLRMLVQADFASPVLFSLAPFEPALFLEAFEAALPTLSSGRFAEVGLALQHGSPRLIARLREPFDVQAVCEAIETLRNADPEIVVWAEMVYGVAGESAQDVKASLEVAEKFDDVVFNLWQPTTEAAMAPRLGAARSDRVDAVMQGWWKVTCARGVQPGARRVHPFPALASQAGWMRKASAQEPAEPPSVVVRSVFDGAQKQEAWLIAEVERVAALLRENGGVVLPHGWMFDEAHFDAKMCAGMFTAHSPRGDAMVFGVRRADAEGAYLVRAKRYAIWLVGDASHYGEDERDVITAFAERLSV